MAISSKDRLWARSSVSRSYHVRRFTEKPNRETAARMVAGGIYSWNSGMFIWQVKRILEEFERQMPEFYAQLMEVDAALGTAEYEAVLGPGLAASCQADHRLWCHGRRARCGCDPGKHGLERYRQLGQPGGPVALR